MSNITAREPLILNHEELYEEAALLENSETLTLDGVTTISGIHPVHGRVHLVVPPIGPCLVLFSLALVSFCEDLMLMFLELPFASQSIF